MCRASLAEPWWKSFSCVGRPSLEKPRYSGIGEDDIELALPALDLGEEAIQVAQVRYVSLNTGHISSDFLYRRCQLRITTTGYEDVRAFVHKLASRSQGQSR